MHTELRGAKVIYQPRQVFGKPWSLERPAVEMMSNGVRPLHPPSWYDDDDNDVMTTLYLVSTFWFVVSWNKCCTRRFVIKTRSGQRKQETGLNISMSDCVQRF